jgi:hypothetical protein
MLPSAALGDTTRDHFLSIGAGLQILSAQVQALQKVSMPAQAETLTCELIVEIEGCRAVLYEACSCLVSRPESLDYATILDRLEVSLSRFRESLDSAFEANKENADLEVTYRILGTYRKISNALMDVIRRFAPVDWVHLSESRF